MRGVLFGEAPSAAAIANIEQSVAALRKASYMKAIEAIVGFDSTDMPEQIRVPPLLIGGSHDKLIPLADMRELERAIADAELVVVDGAGHLLNLEQPDTFNATVARFLSRHANA